MESLMDSLGLPFEFIEAVDGKELTKDEINQFYDHDSFYKKRKRVLQIDELGCALSHVKIWQKMKNENIDEALVFEDDIQISEDLRSVLENRNNLPLDWEVVMLGYANSSRRPPKWTNRFYKLFWPLTKKKIFAKYKSGRFLQDYQEGTLAYLINRRGVKKLLVDTPPLSDVIDCGYVANSLKINLYGIYPILVSENIKAFETTMIDRQNLGLGIQNAEEIENQGVVKTLSFKIIRRLKFYLFLIKIFTTKLEKY